jgi:hypothetical protein
MRKCTNVFTIYEEVVNSHIWLCTRSLWISYYMRKILFYFLSVFGWFDMNLNPLPPFSLFMQYLYKKSYLTIIYSRKNIPYNISWSQFLHLNLKSTTQCIIAIGFWRKDDFLLSFASIYHFLPSLYLSSSVYITFRKQKRRATLFVD